MGCPNSKILFDFRAEPDPATCNRIFIHQNGHCKNFEISAALAVVCGFRVYLVYLIFTCGGVYVIRR